MTYTYYCKNCKKAHDIEKSIKESSKEEICPKCNEKMQRVFRLSGIKTRDGIKCD